MVAAVSAGLLMYSINNGELKVFLVHPGGPFFKNKDEGYWGIPKGLHEYDETLLDTALREFREETGIDPAGDFLPLGSVKQKNGKTVHAWAFRDGNNKPVKIQSNTFELEWPPNSGIKQHFPEVDKGEFFSLNIAREKIAEAQKKFISELERHLNK
ncbi:MAG: NUDIX domain-containing protein [Ignavibacteriaceae bacterium]|jgi:predicted NUDIX family NTP pyrophosphohydrolase